MFETKEKSLKLPNDLIAFIKEWKEKKGSLIMILHKTQEIYGYIPRDVALELSIMLATPLAKIYGVITFYHFFRLTKPGKHTISVCMGTACSLKGAGELVSELETTLNVKVGETTEDGQFSLISVRCLGCCGLSPVMTVDGVTFSNVTKDEINGILAKYNKK